MANQELIEVKLEEYGFSFHVMLLPKKDIEDKLALASDGSGLLCQMEYQNFLFVELVMNLERMFHFIADQTGGDPEEMIELRNKIIALVFTINPGLAPENLVITDSGIIKTKDKWEGVPLVDNSDWSRVTEDINPLVIIEEVEIIETSDQLVPLDSVVPPKTGNFDLIPVKWPRLNIVLQIRKFSKNDLSFIFGSVTSFEEELHYQVHIVQKCIDKAESVFALCDATGISRDVSVPSLAAELYQLCIEINPFLKQEELDLSDFKPTGRKPRRNQRTKTQNSPQKKKGTGKKFSDVTREELLTLATRIKSKVIGQDEAVDKIVDTIQIASCGLRNPELPIAVYLLCGTTGIGKTFVSKVLAEELCGSRDNIVRVDCSEYTQQHDIQKLIGAPPSFVGYEDGGFLTNAVQDNPFSIVLFDEVEKAHSKLFDLLLQVMDDARLTDGKGVVTDFKDCIILMTSNVGVSETEAASKTMGFGDSGLLTNDVRDEALKQALKNRFRPEFLNRIDDTIRFSSLQREEALRVAALLLDKVKLYLGNKKIMAEFTGNVISMAYDKGFSKKFGARPLQRAIDKEVIKPLAKFILRGDIKEGMRVRIDYRKDKLCVREIKPQVSRKVKQTSLTKV